jgi:hypothetical protein
VARCSALGSCMWTLSFGSIYMDFIGLFILRKGSQLNTCLSGFGFSKRFRYHYEMKTILNLSKLPTRNVMASSGHENFLQEFTLNFSRVFTAMSLLWFVWMEHLLHTLRKIF